MRIVIDLQSCQSEGSRSRGIGRYSTDLVQAMAKQAGEHELWLALNGNFPEAIRAIHQDFASCISAERIYTYDVPTSIGMMEVGKDWRRRAAERTREHAITLLNPDVVHVSSLFEGLGDDAVVSIGGLTSSIATTVTLYDLIPLIRSETYLANKITRAWYYQKLESLKKADLLLAISESSRQEALRFLELPEDKVVTVSTAVPDHFVPMQFSAEQTQQLYARYGMSRPFVMYTGGIDSRKNIEGLIESYVKLPLEVRGKYQLVIVCSVKPHDRNYLMAITKQHQLTDEDVILTGFVPEEDLVALYNLCELFVFPSLHEGFGLPALEAMSCGAVVIGSNASSIPEVIGRRDALFEPTKAESIAKAMYKGLTDRDFRASFRSFAPQQTAKFSWEISAKKTLDAFAQLHEKRCAQEKMLVQVSVPTPMPKLAFISPLPPEKTGIAEYSADLLKPMSKHYKITVIVNQPETNAVAIEDGITVRSIEWYEAHATSFSRRLYHFGNSSYHHHMFKLLERFPGVVVLHDFYLSGALHWMDIFTGPAGLFVQELYHSHGYTALCKLFEKDREIAAIQFPMNKTVVENATGIIVHSQHSKNIADKWYGENVSKDWAVIPHLHTMLPTISREEARQALQIEDNDFVVCSFGILAPTKLNNRLLEAFINSELSNNRHCHLIFVGENNKDEFGQRLVKTIEQRGAKTNIEITGFVSMEKYRQYLAAADIAVQLRLSSRGETSRAVLESLSYGLPLVINSHGSLAEYPDDIVVKLPDSFSDHQLIQALESLHKDARYRRKLGEAGYRYVTEHNDPDQIALRYRDVLESYLHDSAYSRYQELLSSLATIQSDSPYTEKDLIATADAIANNSKKIGQPRLLIDVSHCVQNRLRRKRGENVKLCTLFFLRQTMKKFRVEPIYFDGKVYRYARRFTLNLLKLKQTSGLRDDPVDIARDDCFLGLNVENRLTSGSFQSIEKWNQMGVKIYLVIVENAQKDFLCASISAETLAWKTALIDASSGIFCMSAHTAQRIKSQSQDGQAQIRRPKIFVKETTQTSMSDFLSFIQETLESKT